MWRLADLQPRLGDRCGRVQGCRQRQGGCKDRGGEVRWEAVRGRGGVKKRRGRGGGAQDEQRGVAAVATRRGRGGGWEGREGDGARVDGVKEVPDPMIVAVG